MPPADGTVAIVAAHDGTTTEFNSIDALPALLADREARIWIDLTQPSVEQVSAVAAALGLHPLIAEDIGAGGS